MIEVEIDGLKRYCFLVKRGEVNNIVIPLDALLHVDYKRLQEMEAQGGELMKALRDTKLDNGLNALMVYQHLFKVVPVKRKPEPVKLTEVVHHDNVVIEEAPTVKKRGRRSNAELAAMEKQKDVE